MIYAKRVAILLILSFTLLAFYLLRFTFTQTTLRDVSQVVGLGEYLIDKEKSMKENEHGTESTEVLDSEYIHFIPGTPKSPGSRYTRGLVMGRLSDENTTWFAPEDFPELQTYIYVVDDSTASLHTPQNKGNEAMVYLSYIIDHYDDLPDVTMFIHAHRMAWHTNVLLNHDALEMIKRLSSERVIREGYMNLRCQWDPGCPSRVRPGAILTYAEKLEEQAIARVWAEWFPEESLPDALGTPCCAQFALSREKIRSIPKARFEYYRNWLLRTQLDTWISGRVFEHLWQKIFTNKAQVCPDMRICYCDGYGICFKEQDTFDYWFELRYKHSQAQKALKAWKEKAKKLESLDRSRIEELDIVIPEAGEDVVLQDEIHTLFKDMIDRRLHAMELGLDPRVRAEVAGREWKEGDGY